MKFTKMDGCGNDYVYIDCFKETVENPEQLAIDMSHRRFGIGSDGLVLIKPTTEADAEMEMFNPDGTKSEMCGNALRCVSKYVYDHDICKKDTLRLKTGAGIKTSNVFPNENDLIKIVTIDMAPPILSGLDIPTIWDEEQVVNKELVADDKTFLGTCVSMGNPHCVIYVDDVDNFPVEKYGSILETSQYFPNKVNVEFIEVISKDEVKQRTWERGTGETWACGTGASAVVVAGVLTGKTSEKLLIHLLGGDLKLQYQKGGTVIMTGPAREVFQGEYNPK